MNEFENLLKELGDLQVAQDTMAKALPADGKDEQTIQAAAAEGGQGDGDEDDKGGKPDGDADDGKMVKSFEVTLPDGEKAEAVDGFEMLKSFGERMDASEGKFVQAMSAVAGVIKSQSELIKSLGEQVSRLSNQGSGRKSVLTIAEKPEPAKPLVKSLAPEGMSTEQFFAKALNAQKEGRISGTDIAVAESCLNRGQEIPAAIVQRVIGQ